MFIGLGTPVRVKTPADTLPAALLLEASRGDASLPSKTAKNHFVTGPGPKERKELYKFTPTGVSLLKQ